MASTEFPNPQPRRLDWITPSIAADLLTCGLRIAFSSDARTAGWRRPGTASSLGVAAHEVAEVVAKRGTWSNDPGTLRAELSDLWDAAIKRAAKVLAAAWAPATPPPPSEWPGYELTRMRTLRRAARLLEAGGKGYRSASPPKAEVNLCDEQTAFRGRADRVEVGANEVRVVDLKTGIGQGPATAEQRRQLLLYAHLLHVQLGRWPSVVAVEDASGERRPIAVDPREVEAVVDTVTTARGTYNGHVEDGTIREIGAPSPDTCRFCAFKVVCSRYFDAAEVDWDHRAATGTVHTAGPGFVTIDVTRPSGRTPGQLHLSQVALGPITVGAGIAVDGWIGRLTDASARANWHTRMRTW